MVGGGGITENMGIPATLEGGTIRTDTLHEPKGHAREGHGNPARVGRSIPFHWQLPAAQGPVVHLPLWRVMMKRCHPGRPADKGEGRGWWVEGGVHGRRKREGAGGVERTEGGWRRRS